MKRILREPIFQFLILAFVIFAYFNVVQKDRPAEIEVDQIVIAENDLRVLIEQHKSIWNRLPTEDELNALIERTIQDIDFSTVLDEKTFVEVATMGAQACSGGACEVNF